MTKGISKKLQRDDLLRKRRQAAQALPTAAKVPPKAIPPSSLGCEAAAGEAA